VTSKVRALSNPSPVDHFEQLLMAIRLINYTILLYTRSHIILSYCLINYIFRLHQPCTPTVAIVLEKSLPLLFSNFRRHAVLKIIRLILEPFEIHAYIHFLIPQNWSNNNNNNKKKTSVKLLQREGFSSFLSNLIIFSN
jgi:hypothetical protein